MTHLDPKERHRLEDAALSRRHAREKLEIERLRRLHARLDTRERASLEKAMRKAERLHEAASLEMESKAEQTRSTENMAMQDFYDAALDQGLWKKREFAEGELWDASMMPPGSRMGPKRPTRAMTAMRRTCGTTLTMMEMMMAGRPVTGAADARVMGTEGTIRPTLGRFST